MAATAPKVRAAAARHSDPGSHHLPGADRPWVAAVIVLTVLGAGLRVATARQTLFGDELATYWDIHSHSLFGLISALHGTHIEITPPLYFGLAWLTSHLGHSPEFLRLPSLIAGTLMIPAVYRLGERTVGRPAGAIAAALTTFSPFMIYYAAEARAYAVVMLLVTLSTLSLLRAVETGRHRWWAGYAVCSCGAVYSHYTSIFYLAVQFLWLLWAHRALWRPALLANGAAAVAFLPWAGAAINANNSPTTAIMSALAPFTLHDVRIYLEHWAIGDVYPAAGGLSRLPGLVALWMLGIGLVLVVAVGLARSGTRVWEWRPVRLDRRRVLVVLLLLATPLGAAAESAVGTHVFGVRNLAASWPALALVVGSLLATPPRPIAVAASALAVAALAIGAVKGLEPYWSKPDSQSAAAFIDRSARPGDVILDGSGSSGTGLMVTPGPLTSLDTSLSGGFRLFRAGTPQERDHPFGFSDAQVPLPAALAAAMRAVRDGRLIAVTTIPRGGELGRLALPGYQLIAQRILAGGLGTAVRVYERTGAVGG